jgi:glycosyltransferase involved in cell wall biosynthesis
MDAKRYGHIVGWSALLSRWPDAIIANSKSGAAFHQSRGFNAHRMVIIENGIDSESFHPDQAVRRKVRQELGIPPDVPVIIHPARVDPMKDHESFLQAMAKMPAITALIVGKGTDQLEVPENVIALGLRQDMPCLYAAADIVVSSSAFGEGFSNVIAEGMSAGLVPVVTDVGDSRRIVGETGRVVPPRDPCALATAIAEECASRPKLVEKGLTARARVVDNFSLTRSVEAFARLYESA